MADLTLLDMKQLADLMSRNGVMSLVAAMSRHLYFLNQRSNAEILHQAADLMSAEEEVPPPPPKE